MAITRFPAAYTRDTISIVLSEKNTTSQALLYYVKIAILLEETSYLSFDCNGHFTKFYNEVKKLFCCIFSNCGRSKFNVEGPPHSMAHGEPWMTTTGDQKNSHEHSPQVS